jgi:hypothetical protein
MANPKPKTENLRPFVKGGDTSIQSAGGRARGKQQKQEKKLREYLKIMMAARANAKIIAAARELLPELDDDEVDNNVAMIAGIMKKAFAGDVPAATWIRDMKGEKPKDDVNFQPLTIILDKRGSMV